MNVSYKLIQFPDYEYETNNFRDLCEHAYSLFISEPLIGLKMCVRTSTPNNSAEHMFFNTIIVGNVLNIHFEGQCRSVDNLYHFYNLVSELPFLNNRVSFLGGSYVLAPNGSILMRNMFFGPHDTPLRTPFFSQIEYDRKIPIVLLNVPWEQEGF